MKNRTPVYDQVLLASVAVGSVFDPSVLHMVLRYSETDFDSTTKDMSVMLLALVGTGSFPIVYPPGGNWKSTSYGHCLCLSLRFNSLRKCHELQLQV